MWNKTKLTELIRIKYPIIQAPMAGGATTAELVASVSNAGGLGSLAAGYLPASKIKDLIGEIRKATKNPFSVNLFLPEVHKATHEQMQIACDAINQCSSQLNVNIEPTLGPYTQLFREQVNVLIEEKIPVFSYTFGILDPDIISQFKANNATLLIGTATTLAEAKALEESGVDAIVAQGSEAGGHHGSFLETEENSLLTLTTLLSEMKEKLNLPIIAAGGIMNGQYIVELLRLGASAVQLGTAFLCCNESGIHPAYKALLLNQTNEYICTIILVPNIYRAIDKDGRTLDWMLSQFRNKISAKRFLKKTLNNKHTVCPRVINVDKSPTFPPALSELQDAGIMPSDTKLRPVKYLNNAMENDHKFIKSKSRYRQWYQSFKTARRTIAGMETMRMVQKGQLRYVAKGDVRAQNTLINKLFNIAA